MIFDEQVLEAVQSSHTALLRFYGAIRAMYRVADDLLDKTDYGVRLAATSPDRLVTLRTGGSAVESSPWCGWISPWIGRFYVRAQQPEGSAQLAFIWIWTGHTDPFVETTPGPEIWLGVADAGISSVDEAVDFVWNNMRYERGTDRPEGWRSGDFRPHGEGGLWALRRQEAAAVVDVYTLQSLVVRPMVDRFIERFGGDPEGAP